MGVVQTILCLGICVVYVHTPPQSQPWRLAWLLRVWCNAWLCLGTRDEPTHSTGLAPADGGHACVYRLGYLPEQARTESIVVRVTRLLLSRFHLVASKYSAALQLLTLPCPPFLVCQVDFMFKQTGSIEGGARRTAFELFSRFSALLEGTFCFGFFQHCFVFSLRGGARLRLCKVYPGGCPPLRHIFFIESFLFGTPSLRLPPSTHSRMTRSRPYTLHRNGPAAVDSQLGLQRVCRRSRAAL